MAKSVHTSIWLLMSVCCHVARVREMDQISNLAMNYRKNGQLCIRQMWNICASRCLFITVNQVFFFSHSFSCCHCTDMCVCMCVFVYS